MGGLSLGSEGSSTVFFLLLGKGLIDVKTLLQIMSSLGFVVLGLFVFNMLRRAQDAPTKDQGDQEDSVGVCEVMNRVYTLTAGSSNVRWWMAFSVLNPELSGHRSILGVRYQAAGFSPEIFSEYDLYLLPVSIGVMWLSGKVASTTRLLSVFSWVSVASAIATT